MGGQRVSRTRFLVAVAYAALLAAPMVNWAPTAEAQAADTGAVKAGVQYAWWGPTDERGWHFRLPVLVHPEFPDPTTKYGVAADFGGVLQETPVRFEVDFSQALRDTNVEGRPGWPMDEFGRLSAFTLDPASVRVVAYERHTGRVDAGQGRDGMVPYAFATQLFENPDGRNPVYNASQNAIGTLQWIVPGPFNEPRLYYVYFDSLENGKKPAVAWSEAELAGLRSLDFLRPATDLFGYVPAIPEVPDARVYVWALYPNTTVKMYRYRFSGFEPQELPPCAKRGAVGMCIAGGELVDDTVRLNGGFGPQGGRGSYQARTSNEPVNEPFFFRVVASKPVHAFVGPVDPALAHQTSYWVPSFDRGLAGTQFRVPVFGGPLAGEQGAPPAGIVVVGGPQDALVDVVVRSGNNNPNTIASNVLVKARTAYRVPTTGYGVNDDVYVFGQDPGRPFMVGMVPYYVHHVNQAVSEYGAPVGTTLFAAPTKDSGVAIVPFETAGVTFYNVEDPSKAYPTDGPQALQAGAENAWLPPPPVFERSAASVWAFRSSGLATAYAGDRGMAVLGGLDAREFQFILRSANTIHKVEPRAFVMPMYPQTRVDIERWDETRQRYASVYQKVVGPDSPVVTKPGSAEPLMHGNYTDPGVYRVRTSKPALVYVLGEEGPEDGGQRFPYQTYLGGKMRTPRVTIGTTEFYGPLVSWSEKIRQETVKPGDQVVVSLAVQNLGRSHDGKALGDSVSFVTRKSDDAPDWTTRLSTAFEANVPGGQSREVTVVVDVPKEAKTEEALDLEIVAVSETNPAIRDVALVQITVQTRYEIEVAFRSNNKATLQSVVDPGQTKEFAIRVKNIGSGPDGVSFTMLKANPFGFDAELFYERVPGDPSTRESLLDRDGLPRMEADGTPFDLRLDVNEERLVFLVVAAPVTSDPAQHNFVVEATSASDASSRKQLQLVALTNAKTALRIQALNETFEVTPGRNATLPLEIVNEGVETAVDMTFRAPDLPGWSISLDPPQLELRSPGVVDPRDGSPLDRRVVNLTVRAGPDAEVGFIMPIEVTAASATRLGDAEAPSAKVLTSAVVVNNFTLLVPEILERSLLPGEVVEYEVPIRSLANGNFTVEPVATRLPPGWRVDVAGGPLRMAPDDERVVRITLGTRANEAAGSYAGEFGFVMQDEDGRRDVATAPFEVRVRRHVDYEVVPQGDFLVPPEGTTRAAFTFRNTGNVNATIEISLEAPAGWQAELIDGDQAVLLLAPGEARAVDVRVTAPSGPTEDTASFAIRGDIPSEREKATPFEVTVLRDDLVLLEVKALTERFRVGQPAVFQVTLLNNGTIPRTNVDVALLVDGAVARNVTVRSVPPGEARTVQVPWNVVPADVVEFVVDADDRYHEEDEGNNVRMFDLRAASARGVPGVAPLALAVLAGAAALAFRRWR